jgi:Transposase domain (DUF772)
VIREVANTALKALGGEFAALYSPIGRGSIPPERLMRALLLQAFYSIRSERQLVERIEYDLLFRWFVGLGIEDPVWDATSFTKNRDRLLEGEVAQKFLAAVWPSRRSSACCRATIFRWMARCWRPGRASRAFALRTGRAGRRAWDATAGAISTASGAGTIPTP